MAQTAAVETDLPTDEDFEALLEESYGTGEAMEGRVVKGTIIAIENDFALIDVGLKCEGRVPLREFGERGGVRVIICISVNVDVAAFQESSHSRVEIV